MVRLRHDDIPLRAFKLTYSVPGDISEQSVGLIKRWAEKNADMHHLVIERGESGKKHLHGLVCLPKAIIKRNVQDDHWKRFIKPFHPDAKQRCAVHVDVLYNSVWRDEYLKKEADHVVVSTDYDDERSSEYYPDQATQDRLQAIAAASGASDTFYASHAVSFQAWFDGEYHSEPGPRVAITIAHGIEYFYYRMHVAKDMQVMIDERRIRQMGHALYRYVTSSKELSFEDRKYVASCDGPAMDFRG